MNSILACIADAKIGVVVAIPTTERFFTAISSRASYEGGLGPVDRAAWGGDVVEIAHL